MKSIIYLFFLLVVSDSFAQSEEDLVRLPLNDYMIGTSYNHIDQIKRAFHQSAFLYLTRNGSSWIVSPSEYADLFKNRVAGEFNGRHAKILRIDIYQDVAYAEIEIKIPGSRFIDLILLKKMDGVWLIISKTATRYALTGAIDPPKKETIVEGLKRPWSMAFIAEHDVLISEKDGQLIRLNLKTKNRSPISGLPEDLFTPILLDMSKNPKGSYPSSLDGQVIRANAGLLEVLLDPDFDGNRFVYLSYVSKKENQFALKIIRAKLINDRLTEVETLLNPGPYKEGLYHFGGGMVIGSDGKLYITAGERLFFEYEKEGLAIAQDLTDARGKIYRINPDGSIPEDNPDFGPEAVKGIYASGIRAAQGITVRPENDEIWFSEHGTIQGDEINKLSKGANYGWPNITSGKYRSPGYSPAPVPKAEFADPVHYWLQTVAPTGLTFYTGNEFPEWSGNLIVPGLSRGSLWRLALHEDKVISVEELFVDNRHRLRKAIQSPGGILYLLTDEENGKIIRVSR